MWELDVFDYGTLVVPLRLDRVSCSQDGGSGIQLANDSGLGDGQRLLFHHFMKNRPGGIAHLRKIRAVNLLGCN